MAVVIVATPGAANANSYETLIEAKAYFESRAPLSPAFDDADSPSGLLVMATRVLDSSFTARKILKKDDCDCQYYAISRGWSGSPATTTQKLAWPRKGMKDRNGNDIPDNVIPQDLKDAESELAGQLNVTDSTLDNDANAQGIKSVKAGSVAVVFRDYIESHVIPDAVFNMMPPSWFTDEIIEPLNAVLFDVVSE